MPIFLDRHDRVEFSPKEVAKLHVKDLEVQDKYGVKFLTYWYDAKRRTTFCLVNAPDKETADRCKWRLEFVILRKQTRSLYLVRSGMRVSVSIWCLRQRVLKS
jgi:Protein of unknown function (DUF4242)